MLFVSLGSAPAAAGTFPDENTRIVQVIIYDNAPYPNYRVLVNYDADRGVGYATIGTAVGTIRVLTNVGFEYVADLMAASSKTHVTVKITDPTDNVVLNVSLEWASTGSWFYPTECWRVTFKGENLNIVLNSGTYKITTIYEVYTTSWEKADTWIDYLEVGETLPEPDIPEATPSVWLPVMLSFAVIAGMAFIGLNLARGSDPTPGLFMLFAGVVLVWSVGWLPTWIFVTALALISISSAALWGKLFKRGGG